MDTYIAGSLVMLENEIKNMHGYTHSWKSIGPCTSYKRPKEAKTS